MKKTLVAATGLLFAAGVAFAEPVNDWPDLVNSHNHILKAINEMERARAANHYDMEGHGAKAEALLRKAEREITLSIRASRHH